jgi:hypothetical protein
VNRLLIVNGYDLNAPDELARFLSAIEPGDARFRQERQMNLRSRDFLESFLDYAQDLH